ncbi:ATP-binding protein [Saccharopolyspora aridisoli]|uniref:ATP-binding protein n=1 Tax=Saccharopolyspora aridisoli TaxID=2530385 RepID=A0A4R4UHR4_9PSEU|nr:ATP-binding protein [Saccharopolyspora aridisoli]TDC89626.1 ATP-binding protein [Saccharopolyspora aridisoli]
MSVEREVAQVDPATSAPNQVEVRVRAEPDQLSVMRAVVGDLAMRADHDVDSIADLRLAVDEACSTLVRLAAPEATLVCRFQLTGEQLSITAEVLSKNDFGPRKDTFSWRVLSALADAVSTSVESGPAANGSHLVRIELTKGRTAQV